MYSRVQVNTPNGYECLVERLGHTEEDETPASSTCLICPASNVLLKGLFVMSKFDVETAAVRYNCSTRAIRRRISSGKLPAMRERVKGSNGRPVIKLMIEDSALDAEFAPKPAGPAAHEHLVSEVTAAVPKLTETQKARIAAALRGTAAA